MSRSQQIAGATGLHAGRNQLCQNCPRQCAPAIPGSKDAGSRNFHPTAADSDGDLAGNIYRYRRVEISLAGFAAIAVVASSAKDENGLHPFQKKSAARLLDRQTNDTAFKAAEDRIPGFQDSEFVLIKIKNRPEEKPENSAIVRLLLSAEVRQLIALLQL
jgi:hypothetical protein